MNQQNDPRRLIQVDHGYWPSVGDDDEVRKMAWFHCWAGKDSGGTMRALIENNEGSLSLISYYEFHFIDGRSAIGRDD